MKTEFFNATMRKTSSEQLKASACESLREVYIVTECLHYQKVKFNAFYDIFMTFIFIIYFFYYISCFRTNNLFLLQKSITNKV